METNGTKLEGLAERVRDGDESAWPDLINETAGIRHGIAREIAGEPLYFRFKDDLDGETLMVLVTTTQDYRPGGKTYVALLRLRIRNVVRTWTAQHAGAVPMPETAYRAAGNLELTGEGNDTAHRALRNRDATEVDLFDEYGEPII